MKNKKKKLIKIAQYEQRDKNKEFQLNEETKAMVLKKDQFVKEVEDLEKVLAMYNEAYPEQTAPQTKKNQKSKKGE